MVESDTRMKDVSVNVSANCNLKCKYCFYPLKTHRVMDWPTAEQAIRWIKENVTPGATVSFFGIEPMMNWRVVKYLIEGLPDFEFDMTTNATRVTKSKALQIAEWNMGVLASWDGLPGCHNPYRNNSYNKTVRGIHLLNEVGVRPGIACTVLPETIMYMKENFEHMVSTADVQFVHFNIVYDWSTPWYWSVVEDEFERLYRCVLESETPEGFMAKWMNWRKKDSRLPRVCPAGITTAGIDWDGQLYPCHRTVHWEKSIGNIWQGIMDMPSGWIANTCEMCTVRYCHMCWIRGPNSDDCKIVHIRERVLERIWQELKHGS